MPQGKEVVVAFPCLKPACLEMRMSLASVHVKTVIEDDGVQPVRWLPHGYGPALGRIHRACFLVN